MTVIIPHSTEELADLIRRANRGEDFIIATDGALRARLVPVAAREPGRGPRAPGRMKGRWQVPDAFFFDPLPEDELRLWEGGSGGPP